MFRLAQGFLQRTGIYEVVPWKDIKSVMGEQGYFEEDRVARWARKDWQLARRVGKELHAEYAMVMERARLKRDFLWEMILINVETGKKFEISVPVPAGSAENYKEIVVAS